MIMKSDISVVIILAQPKGLKKMFILEWTLEKLGHDLSQACSPRF